MVVQKKEITPLLGKSLKGKGIGKKDKDKDARKRQHCFVQSLQFSFSLPFVSSLLENFKNKIKICSIVLTISTKTQGSAL